MRNKRSSNPLKRGSLSTLLASESKQQTATNTWWFNPIMLPLLTIAFSALDGVTLYPVFETLFAQSPLLLYITTFGIALCLNFVPLIAARFLLRYKYSMGEKNLILFIISITVFLLLFSAASFLRIATRNEVLGNLGQSLGSSSGTSFSNTELAGSLPMVILQCVTNFVTSSIAFALSYMSDDPLQRLINRKRRELLKLKELKTALECALVELNEYDHEKALQHEEARFQAANEALDARRDALKVQSDLQLEILLRNPDSSSRITEEAQKEIFSHEAARASKRAKAAAAELNDADSEVRESGEEEDAEAVKDSADTLAPAEDDETGSSGEPGSDAASSSDAETGDAVVEPLEFKKPKNHKVS